MNLGTPASPNRIRLEEIASFEMGQSPDSRYVSESPIGLPFLQGNAEFGVAHPQPRLWCRQPKKVCQVGDSLISVRAPVGALNRADQTYCIGRGLAAVRFNGAEPRYGAHLLAHFAPNLRRKAQGTTFEAVGKNDLATLEVNHFPEAEQARIAEVLDTLDEAIQGTLGIIYKLQSAKQGLLRDLLSSGIGADGCRRKEDVNPSSFRSTNLGAIPKSWLINKLSDCCTAIVDCPHSTPTFLIHGVLVARTMHIKEGQFDTALASRVSESEYQTRIARLKPEPGDVIFTREAPVGEAFVIPEGMKICLGQRVMLLRPNPAIILGDYLVAQIYSGVVQGRIKLLTGGTTNPHLNVAEVRDFALPIPPIEEQRALVSGLQHYERLIQTEKDRLEKLQEIRTDLSSDLLAGRVRIHPR